MEAKIEWHPGELFPRACFVVTNLPLEPEWVSGFYNRRGTAELHIREGKYAIHRTRLSCRRFRDKGIRLELHALAYNLAVLLSHVGLPEPMADWSLNCLQLKLIKIGARVVRHARAITSKLAEVAVTGPLVRAIIAAIQRLRAPTGGDMNQAPPIKPKETPLHQCVFCVHTQGNWSPTTFHGDPRRGYRAIQWARGGRSRLKIVAWTRSQTAQCT